VDDEISNKDEFMGIALIVYLILLLILLEKPSSRSKAKDNDMSLLHRIEQSRSQSMHVRGLGSATT
jgi:hypothetical protein